MGFSRQEYWSGLPCPSPGDFPGPGIEPGFPALAGALFTTEPLGKPASCHQNLIFPLSVCLIQVILMPITQSQNNTLQLPSPY